MSPINRFTACATAASIIILAAGPALAQPQGSSGSQRPDLSSLLHLRADQQGAFRAYQSETQMRPTDQGQAEGMSPQAMAGLTTPARLDRIATFLRLQMARFQRNAEATRAFYGQLTPDQQHTFDQISAPRAQQRRSPQG